MRGGCDLLMPVGISVALTQQIEVLLRCGIMFCFVIALLWDQFAFAGCVITVGLTKVCEEWLVVRQGEAQSLAFSLLYGNSISMPET